MTLLRGASTMILGMQSGANVFDVHAALLSQMELCEILGQSNAA